MQKRRWPVWCSPVPTGETLFGLFFSFAGLYEVGTNPYTPYTAAAPSKAKLSIWIHKTVLPMTRNTGTHTFQPWDYCTLSHTTPKTADLLFCWPLLSQAPTNLAHFFLSCVTLPNTKYERLLKKWCQVSELSLWSRDSDTLMFIS